MGVRRGPRSGAAIGVDHQGRWQAVSQALTGERLPGAHPARFRSGWALIGVARGKGGATTPIEMMYFSASSTLMLSAITSARGTIRKKPEVGLGVVGTYRLR